ncbi:radical SAM protein [bacterium]|nr:radical SAM protein [bacterium]
MKVLLMRPRPSPETIGLQHLMIVEPLELEMLAALIRPPDVPIIIDMILERHPVQHFLRRINPDVFCVTGYITHVRIMIRYCRIAKMINPHIRTIVGGVHCEVLPEDLDDASIDFRVVRNAAIQFPLVLDHIRNGSDLPLGALRTGEAFHLKNLPDYDFQVPFPDRSLTQKYRKAYFYIFQERVALIKTAFGCPHSCNFCYCRKITGGSYHERPLGSVMKELQAVQEKNIYIVDDDFLVSPDRVLRFIEENRSAGLDKRYLVYGRADFIARHPRVIEKFGEAGLRTVIVGLESFDDRELAGYGKLSKAAENREAVRILNLCHIDCYATLILSPHWGRKDFDLCRDNLKALGIHYVNLQPLTPLPGTEIKVGEAEQLFSRHDFEKWDLAHVSIRPTQMSVATFYECILRLYRQILFQPRILLGYVRKYRPVMCYKMFKGSLLVRRQYDRKMREALKNPRYRRPRKPSGQDRLLQSAGRKDSLNGLRTG